MDLLIGNKPIKAYLLYGLSSLEKDDKLTLKARGRSIAKTVDLAEIFKRKLPELKLVSISIGTQTLTDKESKREINVSTLEIELVKQKNKD